MYAYTSIPYNETQSQTLQPLQNIPDAVWYDHSDSAGRATHPPDVQPTWEKAVTSKVIKIETQNKKHCAWEGSF